VLQVGYAENFSNKIRPRIVSYGFSYDRTEGDHLMYVKAGVRRPLVIPMYRAVPVFIIKNLLRTSGMNREKYFKLLKGA